MAVFNKILMINKKRKNKDNKVVDYSISMDSVVAKYATEFLLEATENDITIGFGQRNPSKTNGTNIFSRVVIPHQRVDALIDLLSKHKDVKQQKKGKK